MIYLLNALLGCWEQASTDFRDAPSYNRCLVLKEEAPEDCHQMGRAALAAGDLDMAWMGLSIACETRFDDACTAAIDLRDAGAPPIDAVMVTYSGCFDRSSAVACSTYLKLVEGRSNIDADVLARAKRIVAGTDVPASGNPKAPEDRTTEGTTPKPAPSTATP